MNTGYLFDDNVNQRGKRQKMNQENDDIYTGEVSYEYAHPLGGLSFASKPCNNIEAM